MDQDQSLFEEGRAAFLKKDYEGAEKTFLTLIRSKKSFADVFNMLGIISHSKGEFVEAIKYFEKALKLNPRYTEALLNLAVLYNDLGKYKKASALYKKVQEDRTPKKKEKMDPFIKNKIANQHAALGDLYQGVGLYPESIEEYQKALALRPKFLDIRLKLAICLREEGCLEESLKMLSQVVKSNSSYLDARIQVGVTHYAMGDVKKAVLAWKKVLELNPKHETARMYLKLSIQ